MIPKIIHYCWFSGEKKPRSIQRCIDSWKKVMPDFEIRCWDAHNFDFDSVPFARDAITAKKYAFAADYARLYALYTEGGIYLDSDVEVKKSFESFLSQSFFCGTEAYYADNRVHYRMEAAIMGAVKEHPFVAECMDYYKEAKFTDPKRLKVMPAIISEIALQYNYQYCNNHQQLDNNITVYPTSLFTNDICPQKENAKQVYAIHHNAGSWIEYDNRGFLFKFCRKHDLMRLYHQIEKLRK